MKRHGTKYIAPVIVAALLLVYYLGIAAGLLWLDWELSPAAKALMLAAPLLLSGVVVFVLVQRLREIHGSEEDDLDRY